MADNIRGGICVWGNGSVALVFWGGPSYNDRWRGHILEVGTVSLVAIVG